MSEVSQKQPKQLYMLFFAEMWERFSYYGMRALLVLFMLSHFGWKDSTAYAIYGAYGALVYATPFIGGVLADRILGYRKAVMLGGILMAIGHVVMAGPDFVDGTGGEILFYAALAFLIVGNGLFKPNISSIVGSLYEDGDPRRDAGFTIFYMGVNLGAFLAPLVCGIVGETFGWSYGFSLAGIGMLIGLFVFGRGQKSLGERGLPPENSTSAKRMAVTVGSFLVVPLVAYFVYANGPVSIGLLVFATAVLAYILIIALTSKNREEGKRLLVVFVLIFFSTTFWAFFEQAGSSITMFTDRNVAKGALPTSIFQSVNPLFILLFAPLFSALWTRLARKDKDLSVPVKFALGIFQLGAGFMIMVFGAQMASEDGMVGLIWLLLGYLLHTTGELCLSPVGLSMVTKMSPKRIVAMVLGAWYLSSSLAHIVGGVIAGFTSTDQYMESSIKYEPRVGEKGAGDHVVKFKGFEEKLYEKASGKMVTDPAIIEAQAGDKLDATAYELKPIYTDEVTIDVHVVASADQIKEMEKPDAYNIHTSVKPGETDSILARVVYLDPLGDLTDIKITKQPTSGKVDLVNDKLVYTANADALNNTKPITVPVDTMSTDTTTVGIDTTAVDTTPVINQPTPEPAPMANEPVVDVVECSVCLKEKPEICDVLRLSVTITNESNLKPKLFRNKGELYVLESSALAKTNAHINVLDFMYDPDGDPLSIEITEKPILDNAIVKSSATLNPFVTPSKTVNIYSRVFQYIAYFCFGATLFLLVLAPILKKWMGGVK